MKRNNSDWFLENWQELLSLVLVVFVAVPTLVYFLVTANPKLKDKDTRNQIKDKLTNEMKEISLPAKTAVNKFDSTSKDTSILVSTRYRTEISQQEFINHLTQELQKKGWKSYRGGGSNEISFCREDQKASLEYKGQGGLFGDGGNYFYLDFSVGLINNFGGSRPSGCW